MDDAEQSLRSALIDSVRDIERKYLYPDLGRAFQHWSAVNVLGLDDEHVKEVLADVGGKDGGIDYFYIDSSNMTVEIIQAKFSESLDANIAKESIGALYDIPKRLLANSETNPSKYFRKCQTEYKETNNNKYVTNLIFVVAGNLSVDAKAFVKIKNQELSSNVSFKYYEIKDLLALVGNPNSPSCIMRLFENEYFVSEQQDSKIKKMVATITAEELKNIYEAIGAPTLFSLNPRSYLGRKPISKGIIETIQKEPNKLWHYNNGISAVCERFNLDKKAGTVNIKNLKVVNGCQTMTTIGESTPVADASVVFRLSEANDVKFREKISRFTNDQNRIQQPDMVSNHAFLVELERRFSDYEPFFWERKRGSAHNMTEDEKKRISGKRDLYIIKNSDVARLKIAYMGSPNRSIQLSEQSLFEDNQNDLSDFHRLYKNADPRDFIVPHVLHYWLNTIKKRLGSDDVEDENESKKNLRFLLKYSIGKYYVIGLIGKIFSYIEDPKIKRSIVNKIVEVAREYNDDVADKVISELQRLAEWFAYVAPKILDEQKNDSVGEILPAPIYKREMY